MAHVLILQTGNDPAASAIADLLCQGDGHSTTLVELGSGRLEWLRPDRPDIVLVEIPRASLEVGRWLRTLPVLVGLPLVALTKGARSEELSLLASGAFSLVLASPYRPSRLLGAVRELTRSERVTLSLTF
jgi:CheY-like chemotaxis protein